MGKIVFVVDDMASNLLKAREVLQEHYTVITLSDATKMFEALEKKLPDLILLDIEMPVMSGFDAIKMLKSDPRYSNIPVIFLTAQRDHEIEKQGYELGALDFITKPFTNEGLLQRVKTQIDMRGLFSVLIEHLPMLVIIRDSELNILACNRKTLEMFELGSQEEYIRRSSEFAPKVQPCGTSSSEKRIANLKAALRDGEARSEWMFTLPDGEPLPCEVVIFRVKLNERQFLISYGYDLRAVKEAEEIKKAAMARAHEIEMRLQEQVAAETSRAKTMFIANMSHEIRTPMNSILGYSELALDDTVSATTREYLGKIIQNTKWLLNVTNDVLDISKIETGSVEIERIPFDIGQIMEHCRTLLTPEVTSKGLRLEFYAEEMPTPNIRLAGDPTKLSQICINLLSNAIKFTDSGLISFYVFVDEFANNTCTLRFEFNDTGKGIQLEYLPRIFEPFMQEDGSATRQYGGAGLGLAIANRLVEAMGGKLLVKSLPGLGSTFSFILTFPTIVTGEKRDDNHFDDELIDKPQFNGQEILVADDNSMNLGVVCEHLKRVGLVSFVAKDGKEVVKMVKTRLGSGLPMYDLILMDIHMPKMDGKEAAAIINGLNTGAPIVAMTAEKIITNDIPPYIQYGMEDYLGKPFTAQDLWKCLNKFLKS